MKYLLTLLFIIFSAGLKAQDSLLIKVFQENAHYLNLENGTLSGPGLDFLKSLGKENHFFMIGESHGIAENPEFAAALFTLYKPYGYRYFATETGPYTAELMEDMLTGDISKSLTAHFKEFPWSIPFYSWKEESQILLALDSKDEVPNLWGLDQEFAASFRMFFKRLTLDAENSESRMIAKKYFAMATEAFEQSSVSKNPALTFMAIVKPSDFDKLRKAFNGQEENLQLIDELEKSIEIYQLWFKGEGLKSNIIRAEMMKRHFMEYYRQRAPGDEGRVMGKFGASHIYKGLNGLNIPDIGSFLNELAAMEGKSFFNLYTIAKKGTQNTHNPFSKDESDNKSVYDPSGYLDQVDSEALIAAASDTELTLIDMRPVRKKLFNRQLKIEGEALRKLIWSYDAVLVFPEFTAAVRYD